MPKKIRGGVSDKVAAAAAVILGTDHLGPDPETLAALQLLSDPMQDCPKLPKDSLSGLIDASMGRLNAAAAANEALPTEFAVLLIRTSTRADVFYGEGNHVPSLLQGVETHNNLVQLVRHDDLKVVTAVVELLEQLASTGGDEEIAQAVAQLRENNVVAASREAALRFRDEPLGHHVCALLLSFMATSPNTVAEVLSDVEFTDFVTESLLNTEVHFVFQDFMPAVTLMASAVVFGEAEAARTLIERNGFRLIQKLNDCLTVDDRGEGVLEGWAMAVDVILRRGADGVEVSPEMPPLDGPVHSIYSAPCEQFGLKATLSNLDSYGETILSNFFPQ